MFSWGNPTPRPGRTSDSSSTTTASYPANRLGRLGLGGPLNNSITNQNTSKIISRSEHLSSYLNDPTLKPSTRRVSTDDTTYDTVFQTQSNQALILRVHLPPSTPGLPTRAPGMTLVGVTASHPWMDARMRITGYDSIQTDEVWSRSGMKLSQAVNDVVKHLQLNPPEVIEITDESLKRLQVTISGQHGGTSGNGVANGGSGRGGGGGGGDGGRGADEKNGGEASGGDPPPDYDTVLQEDDGDGGVETCHMPIPAVPSSFPELDDMTLSQIEELISTDSKFKSFVQQMSAVTTLNDLRDSIFKGNVNTATSNLTLQEKVEGHHAEIISLKSTLEEKVEAFRALEARQTEICRPPDKKEVARRLMVAKKEAMDQSEEMAEAWMDEEGDVDDFVEKFLERRKVHHMRAAKIERLKQSS